MPSRYLKYSQSRRDFPDPASPTMVTCRACPSCALSSAASMIDWSSRARPTKGTSRPPPRRAPPAPPPAAPPPTRHHSQGGPGANRLLAALQVVLPGILVDDRRLARPPGDVVDQDRSRLRDRLQAACGVDRVAHDHPLALGANLYCGVSGQHAGTHL